MTVQPRPDGIVVGRPWMDPALDAVLAGVDVGVATDPEQSPEHSEDAVRSRVDQALAHLRTVRSQPERMTLAVDELGDALIDALPHLAAESNRQADPGDRADLLALRARAQVSAAWRVRGRGQAETVEHSAFERFHDLLLDADRTASEALGASAGHVGAAVTRMMTARGLGVPAEDLWTRFDVVRASVPSLYPAHLAVLIHLCRKWYGSHEAMFEFARRVSDGSPEGSCTTTLFVHAHVEHWVATAQDLDGKGRIATIRAFLRQRRGHAEDAARLVRASDSLLALPAEAVHDQPRLPEAHQCLAWFLAETDGDAARLVEHVRRSGRRIGLYPWYEEPDRFAEVMRRAAAA